MHFINSDLTYIWLSQNKLSRWVHGNHGNLDCYQKTLINQRFFLALEHLSTHISSIMACESFFLINEVWYFNSVTLSLHFGIRSLDMWENIIPISILSKGLKWVQWKKSECFWLTGHNDCSRWFASKYLSTFSGFAIITLFLKMLNFSEIVCMKWWKFKEIAKERKITKNPWKTHKLLDSGFLLHFSILKFDGTLCLSSILQKDGTEIVFKGFYYVKRFRV